MENKAQVIQLGAGEGPAYSLAGDVLRLLATGRQTGGAYALAELRVAPGGGPPPHIHHREDEAFFVLEGEVTFTLGGNSLVARTGSFVQGPRGIPHTYKNEGNALARMLVLVTPAGFENFVAEAGQLVSSFDSPPPPVTPSVIERLLAVAPKHGIEILPPPN